MGRSSNLYLERKHHTPRLMYPRPWFATNTLHTHSRPHDILPELQDLENPNARLETVPVELVLGHIYQQPDLTDMDPDFL